MAVTKIKPIKSTLSKSLDCIQNPEKTDGKMLVSSFGCPAETADIEFGFTLAQAIDKGNNLAHHLIQSFEPGETTPEQAHEIGRQLADAVTKRKPSRRKPEARRRKRAAEWSFNRCFSLLLLIAFYKPAWNVSTIYRKSTTKTGNKETPRTRKKHSVYAGPRRFLIPQPN